MGRVFGYCRVSTSEQDASTQAFQIRERGFKIAANRMVQETVSGSVPAGSREKFIKLVEKLEEGDELVVLKLDRLGRDNMDVQHTVNRLLEMGVTIHCLDLPCPTINNAEGKLMLQLFAVFAEFERNRIRERTRESLQKKKSEGVKLGRPEATETTEKVLLCRKNGMTQSQTAKHLGVTVRTVKNHWNLGNVVSE
ncbi:recombinase family protein [Salmonella enterica]|nr:recombinase family protein [Salmonella enterica subsp. enterica serovar Typhimurium]